MKTGLFTLGRGIVLSLASCWGLPSLAQTVSPMKIQGEWQSDVAAEGVTNPRLSFTAPHLTLTLDFHAGRSSTASAPNTDAPGQLSASYTLGSENLFHCDGPVIELLLSDHATLPLPDIMEKFCHDGVVVTANDSAARVLETVRRHAIPIGVQQGTVVVSFIPPTTAQVLDGVMQAAEKLEQAPPDWICGEMAGTCLAGGHGAPVLMLALVPSPQPASDTLAVRLGSFMPSHTSQLPPALTRLEVLENNNKSETLHFTRQPGQPFSATLLTQPQTEALQHAKTATLFNAAGKSWVLNVTGAENALAYLASHLPARPSTP